VEPSGTAPDCVLLVPPKPQAHLRRPHERSPAFTVPGVRVSGGGGWFVSVCGLSRRECIEIGVQALKIDQRTATELPRLYGPLIDELVDLEARDPSRLSNVVDGAPAGISGNRGSREGGKPWLRFLGCEHVWLHSSEPDAGTGRTIKTHHPTPPGSGVGMMRLRRREPDFRLIPLRARNRAVSLTST
jgi:hypothetical protein